MKGQRLVKTRDRLIAPTEVGQDVTAISVDRRRVGFQGERPVETLEGLRVAAQGRFQKTPIMMGLDEAGVELNRAFKLRKRLDVLLSALQGDTQIVIEARIIGLEAYGVAQGSYGVFRLTKVEQGHAPATVRRRKVGFQRYGATVTGQCISVASDRIQSIGEVGLQKRVVGFDGGGRREGFHGLGGAAHPRERGSQELKGIAIAWLGCKELSIGFDRFGEPSLLVERVGSRERLVAAVHCG